MNFFVRFMSTFSILYNLIVTFCNFSILTNQIIFYFFFKFQAIMDDRTPNKEIAHVPTKNGLIKTLTGGTQKETVAHTQPFKLKSLQVVKR